ncbi:MAG: hypothetical protein JHC26_00415 [Thermofilum sp.]|jgi:hypothetical protein|uniref:hypothetical protein n=1 Tax=Thermofilum sp. TaxID=1961369 RepID=UPI002590794A|nr:hypothetical protein [Thermofilum sp.]MCI4407528.1 hypothetical protein [Thermofilum sp.]
MVVVKTVRSLRTFTKTLEDPTMGTKKQSVYGQITIPSKILLRWLQAGVKAVVITYDSEKPFMLQIEAVPSIQENQAEKKKPDNPIDLIEEYEL